MEHCADYADKRPFRYIAWGDYIDRGPDSASVVRLMECLSTQKPVPSRKWLEFGDAISERMKLSSQAARSIG